MKLVKFLLVCDFFKYDGFSCFTSGILTMGGTLTMHDEYDWRNPENKSVNIGGVRIYDKWALNVEEHGHAQSFLLRGDIAGVWVFNSSGQIVSFNEGQM